MNRIGYYVFRWYAVAIKLISQKGGMTNGL